jgi:hypothetical protein
MKENPEVPTNTRVDFERSLQHAHGGLACFESLISCLLAAAEKHILVNLVGLTKSSDYLAGRKVA